MMWTESLRQRWRVFGIRSDLLGVPLGGLCWVLFWGGAAALAALTGFRSYSWSQVVELIALSFAIGCVITTLRVLASRTIYLRQSHLSIGRYTRGRQYYTLVDSQAVVVNIAGHDVLQITCQDKFVQLPVPDPHAAAATINEAIAHAKEGRMAG